MIRRLKIVVLPVTAMLLSCGKPVDPGVVSDSIMDAKEHCECVPVSSVTDEFEVILIGSDTDVPSPPRIGVLITVEPGQRIPLHYFPAEIGFDGEGRLKIRILIGSQEHVCGEVCQQAWDLVFNCPCWPPLFDRGGGWVAVEGDGGRYLVHEQGTD